VWVSPPHDEPSDLAARLIANGFENAGDGLLMIVAGDGPSRSVVEADRPPGIRIHRFERLREGPAREAAERIVGVLVAAFGVGEERRAGIVAETMATLADRRFTHYVITDDDEPLAAARRATFHGLSYLSSIGTVPRARGRGLGRLVTAVATADGKAAGSEWIHLGVFADNPGAIGVYRSLGFELSGEPGPDLLLVGS
jgi:ribosomal-protein-alanine N-acetyltransferase